MITTLNVQHIESRADAVQADHKAQPSTKPFPTRFSVWRTRSSSSTSPPRHSRERLSEGKVYMEGRAAVAAENFFKDTHLTALRELALRFVAEHVDKRLQTPGRSGH